MSGFDINPRYGATSILLVWRSPPQLKLPTSRIISNHNFSGTCWCYGHLHIPVISSRPPNEQLAITLIGLAIPELDFNYFQFSPSAEEIFGGERHTDPHFFGWSLKITENMKWISPGMNVDGEREISICRAGKIKIIFTQRNPLVVMATEQRHLIPLPSGRCKWGWRWGTKDDDAVEGLNGSEEKKENISPFQLKVSVITVGMQLHNQTQG